MVDQPLDFDDALDDESPAAGGNRLLDSGTDFVAGATFCFAGATLASDWARNSVRTLKGAPAGSPRATALVAALVTPATATASAAAKRINVREKFGILACTIR